MRHYQNKLWKKYRAEIIESDGGVCVRCRRGPSQGATLQVHHKKYLSGKLPWEYPPNLCETLCKGCHAQEHGQIRPSSGWECIGEDDLGDLIGECELCGNAIRYVFLLEHPKWPLIEVGVVCCDHLTQTSMARDHMKYTRRLRNFVSSNRWNAGDDGSVSIVQNGIRLSVESIGSSFRILANDKGGKRRVSTIYETKKFILI